MKATLRIPTEQYAFIEVEVEAETLEDVHGKYLELKQMVETTEGLPKKEFDAVLDKYLAENKMFEDEYHNMNSKQQDVIQTIKRSIKRIKRKYGNT